MNLLEQRGVTDDDLSRYLSGCIVFDRQAGHPAIVVSINSRNIRLRHYPNPLATVDDVIGAGDRDVTYAAADHHYLYDMETYALPEAGWRQLGEEAVHLGRVLVNNGVRGIPPDRLRVTRVADLYPSVGLNFRAFHGTRVHAHQIVPLIFNIPNSSLKDAVAKTAKGYAQAVTRDLCVIPVRTNLMDNKNRYTLYHDTNAIGAGVDNRITILHEKLIHLLGDTDGFVIDTRSR